MTENNRVFDDIMQGLHEIKEYYEGNLELTTRKVALEPKEMPDAMAILWHKMIKLPEPKRQQLNLYLDELLRA